jgi:hypothetical protein
MFVRMRPKPPHPPGSKDACFYLLLQLSTNTGSYYTLTLFSGLLTTFTEHIDVLHLHILSLHAQAHVLSNVLVPYNHARTKRGTKLPAEPSTKFQFQQQ